MNIQEKMQLIKQNTIELVTEQEIQSVVEKNKTPVAYCGYEPSGPLHIGHAITATKLLDLDKAGFKVKILLADYHAYLNNKGTFDDIKVYAKKYETAFKKLGLKNAEYVLGTSFQRKAEYFDDVLRLALHTTLNRGLRSMQDVARDLDNATISQAVYPLMQIVDMKYLKVNVAEAGLEQRKIHMLGREVFQHIGYPMVSYIHTPLLVGLTGEGKMSSSKKESMIAVTDSPAEIEKKINKAVCAEGVIENNPVLQMAQLVVFPRKGELKVSRPPKFGGNKDYHSYAELEADFAAKKLHPMDLKKAVSESLSEIFEQCQGIF